MFCSSDHHKMHIVIILKVIQYILLLANTNILMKFFKVIYLCYFNLREYEIKENGNIVLFLLWKRKSITIALIIQKSIS